MPRALILITDGTEELEFVTTFDVLTRAGFEVFAVAVELQNDYYAICSHGVCILPDARYLSRVPAEFQAAASEDGNGGADVLVVPGGAIGAMILKTNEAVQELVGQFRDNGKWVTAICGGTLSLVTSQLAAAAAASASTTGSPVPVPVPDSARPGRVTGYPSTRAEIVDVRWEYAHESERVVVDGRLITSQGPGTALLFALTIVEHVAGRPKREEVEQLMLCADSL